jgi:hypothetical protein
MMLSRSLLILLSLVATGTGCRTSPAVESAARLRAALLLHASFDQGVNADFAVGDPKLYTAPTGNRSQAHPGLPASNLVVRAKSAGRYGDALHFTQKMRPVVFFQGERNLGYQTNGWSGAVSLWLRLNPDKDLQPGYCDPLQFVAQGWDEGNMFIEFSKDHLPRHFRYAIQPVKKTWNPSNRGWEEIPDPERPMVAVYKPPFTHDDWTHVVFCFGNINSAKQAGWGRLYLDGKDQGAFENWPLAFNWDVSQSALTLGLSYIGWIDDLAVFNRPLTAAEVCMIHELKNGVSSLPSPAGH